MEFPHLGVHCAFASCSKLDFLPFECDCCHKIFCQEHRVYSDHQCTESYIKDVHVPVCPLCNKPIPMKNGEDPNISVDQHIMRDCKEKKDKLYSNRCSFPGCKKKELVQMTCSGCHRNYCIKHRLETDHDCVRGHSVAPPTSKPKSTSSRPVTSNRPVSTSGNRKPQSSLLTQIGADLNKERQDRLRRQQQTNKTGTTSHSTLSEDEALAMAVAASLRDSQSSQPSANKTTPSYQLSAGKTTPPHQQEQNLEEDEALARALAASLNDQPQSSGSGKNQNTRPRNGNDCVIS